MIEDITIDSKGRAIPKLYSKLQASKELRAMLDIGKPMEASDVTRLSDAELIQQLADTAKELGIEVNLNYRFFAAAEGAGQVTGLTQTPPTTEGPGLEARASCAMGGNAAPHRV